MHHLSLPRLRTALVLAALALFALAPDTASASKSLTLRVNDARGGPGDLVAVVVRTYSSRPIGQGQICVGTRRKGRRGASAASMSSGTTAVGAATAAEPFVRLERAEVFSAAQDARFTVTFDAQEATLRFSSPTGSINAADGPLAVLYFRLANSVEPGDVFEIFLDTGDSRLYDGSGQPIAIESKPGQLEIRKSDDENEPFELGVTGGRVKAGKVARVMIGSGDRIALASGRVALRYDPKVVSGRPWVRLDSRHGRATVLVDTDKPGLVLIDFQSPDRSFNRVPGDLFEVRFAISRQAPRGRTPLTLAPGLTSLRDDQGDVLRLKLENGALIIR